MKLMPLTENQIFQRSVVSGLVILILMFANHLFIGPLSKILVNILIGITFLVILITPKSKWTHNRLMIAALVLIPEITVGIVWFHETKLVYFLAIVVLSTIMRLSFAKSPIPVMAAMFFAAILYIRFGSDNLYSIIPFLLLSVVIYFFIRIRMQRNEMIDLDRRHLAELREAYDQLQEASITAMEYAVLEERTRIARDMHDAVGHSLTSLIVQMQALRYMIKKDPEEAVKSLENMLPVARQGLQDIRTSVHSLADDRSSSGIIPLKALLSRMEATTSIRSQFLSEVNEEEINDEVYGILFRVLQEAITNIIRHSQATMVNVNLIMESNRLELSIQDNGELEKSKTVTEGFGLRVMRSRLEERGGDLKFSILEPHGFRIIASIPLEFAQY